MHVARAQIVSGSEAAPSSVGTTLSARLSGGQLALSPEVPHPGPKRAVVLIRQLKAGNETRIAGGAPGLSIYPSPIDATP